MLNWFFPEIFPEWFQHVLFPLNRFLHIVCTTLLVGGSLFYEFVIPRAIMDLKEETQLAVLGRVRWFFRKVVIFSTAVLVVTGALSCYHQWRPYTEMFRDMRWWIVAHIAVGVFALIVALVSMIRTRAPRTPLAWLRINFVILLVVIFIAAVSRHMRMTERDNMDRIHVPNVDIVPNHIRP